MPGGVALVDGPVHAVVAGDRLPVETQPHLLDGEALRVEAQLLGGDPVGVAHGVAVPLQAVALGAAVDYL